MGNRSTGVGNLNRKGKEQVSSTSFVEETGKFLRTCLLAGSEISGSQTELFPSCFPLILVVASPDLVERWVVPWTGE